MCSLQEYLRSKKHVLTCITRMRIYRFGFYVVVVNFFCSNFLRSHIKMIDAKNGRQFVAPRCLTSQFDANFRILPFTFVHTRTYTQIFVRFIASSDSLECRWLHIVQQGQFNCTWLVNQLIKQQKQIWVHMHMRASVSDKKRREGQYMKA